MKLSQVTPSIVDGIWTESALSLPERPYISSIASSVVDGLYENLNESLVMLRAFITIPYQALPERQQQFAANLARSVELEGLLLPHTPVLSLLATRGQVAQWDDPRLSQGHVAIPLLSEAFVSSIPMMSRLLKELGLPLSWVQDPGAVMERQMIGSDVGVFFVGDPSNAIDELGRKIIPAQDFVSANSVNSVFSVGGAVFGGAVFLLIFFCRDRIESRTPRAFMPLINQVKGVLVSRCSISRAFPPENSSTPDGCNRADEPSAGDK